MLINTSETIIFETKGNRMIMPSSKIYIDKSPIHGLGVFALSIIEEGEVFEICPVIDMGIKSDEYNNALLNYRFNWPQGNKPEKQVAPIGFAMMYNHSNTPNATWRSNFSNNTFEFYSIKKILPNEEIFTWYGDENYWKDGRDHIKII